MRTWAGEQVSRWVGIAAVLLVCGCASVKQDPMGEVTFWAEQAAREGTIEVLLAKPEYKERIERAAVTLEQLIAREQFDMAAFLGVYNQLPVKELKSRGARLAAATGRIVFYRYGKEVAINSPERVKALMVGVRNGLRDGLE